MLWKRPLTVASAYTRSRRIHPSRCTISIAVEHATRQIGMPSALTASKRVTRVTMSSLSDMTVFSVTVAPAHSLTSASFRENLPKTQIPFTTLPLPWSLTHSWSIKLLMVINDFLLTSQAFISLITFFCMFYILGLFCWDITISALELFSRSRRTFVRKKNEKNKQTKKRVNLEAKS